METMQFGEAKKLLYKHKPTAIMEFVNKEGVIYTATTMWVVDDPLKTTEGFSVTFVVPFEDITGDAKFKAKMEAQLLNRWITSFASL